MKREVKWGNVFILFFGVVAVVCGLVFLIAKLTSNEEEELKIEEKQEEVIGAKKEGPNTFLGKIVNNTNKEIDEEMEKFIISFFDKYYKIMYNLKEEDMTNFFTEDAYKDALINQTAIRVLVSSRSKELNDLTLDKAKYNLYYDEIEKDGNVTKITILEDAVLNFNFMIDVDSKVHNLVNELEIVKVGGEYKIKSFYHEQDFFVSVLNSYSCSECSKENVISELEKIEKNLNAEFAERFKRNEKYYQEYISNVDKKFKTCDNNYDRDAALGFALEYVTKYTDPYYGYYGGNCQNYASYMIYAGGVPMDYTGHYQWKHYDSEVNVSNKPLGRSQSWTVVPYFREYALNNTGYGLCSAVDANLFYAEAGDIIQVGYNGNFTHTTVVVDTYKANGKVKDILINSNTLDLENFPISAYSYPLRSLIKVLGWNN